MAEMGKKKELFTEEDPRSYLCFVIQMDFILFCAMKSVFVVCVCIVITLDISCDV